MAHRNLVGQRLLAVFLLGWALFNYPVLALLEGAGDWMGMPAIYVFVFLAWALLIALMAYIAEYSQRKAGRHGNGRSASQVDHGK